MTTPSISNTSNTPHFLAVPPTVTRSRRRGTRDPASALESRRKSNRESMKRARQRDREQLAVMRKQIHMLEQQYQNALQSQHQREQEQGKQVDPSPLVTAYKELLELSQDLKQDNFAMMQMLEARQKVYERLERVLGDYHAEKIDVDQIDVWPPSPSIPGLRFLGISEGEALSLMAECKRQVGNFDQVPVSSEDSNEYMGWAVMQKVITQSKVKFFLSKDFQNVSPVVAAKKSWDIFEEGKHDNMKPAQILRLETLQVVNENTLVKLADMVTPTMEGVILRMIFLRFRLENENGYVQGQMGMHPDSDIGELPSYGDTRKIVHVNLTSWMEFMEPQLKSGEGNCTIRYGGYCEGPEFRDLGSRFVPVLLSVLQTMDKTLEHRVPLLLS